MNEMRPKLNKKVMLQAVAITAFQLLTVSAVITLIVKVPIIALSLLVLVLLSFYTMSTYGRLMFMNQNQNQN